jgi:1-acyl-sn-glycerol-3-phosphate acyltransferase
MDIPMKYTLFSTPFITPALRVLSKIILKIIKWRVVGTLPEDHKKYVLIVAPHTSNWDFFLFIFAVSVLNLKPSVLIKDTIFIGPLGWFLRYCGAIPVNRRQANSLVSHVSKIYENNEEFVLIITPEGTRSPNPNWKRGFHHIASAANVPILVVYVDSSIRTIGIEGFVYPTDDAEKDILEIKKFFDTKEGLKPENYAS